MRNPFKPSFGVTPPLLAGRDELIEEFADALDDGPGSAGRATLYTGARGAGKTVMLNAVEDEAKSRGWLVVAETASPGLIDRLTQSRLPALLRQFDPKAVQHHLTGFTLPAGAGGVTWSTLEAHVVKADLREQVFLLTDILREGETGLLLTLDELHANQIAELRELATVVQHAFRENRELAFAGAGLTASVSDVLNDDVLTFLRRAERHHLGPVDLEDVHPALEEPILAAGRTVDPDALELMADATQGYPFLIQLVGSRSWQVRKDEIEISLADARKGVAQARRRLGSLVHAPALKAASDVDKSFLLAMAKDDGPSKMEAIAERLKVKKGYAGVYRKRLIAAELIVPTRRGYVDYTLPYLRDYLREHAAAEI